MTRHPKLSNLNEPRFLSFLDKLEDIGYPAPFTIGTVKLVLSDGSEIHLTNQCDTVIFYFYRFDVKHKRFDNRDRKTQFISLYYQQDPCSLKHSILYAAEELKKSAFDTTREDFFDVIMRQSEFMAQWFLFNPIL